MKDTSGTREICYTFYHSKPQHLTAIGDNSGVTYAHPEIRIMSVDFESNPKANFSSDIMTIEFQTDSKTGRGFWYAGHIERGVVQYASQVKELVRILKVWEKILDENYHSNMRRRIIPFLRKLKRVWYDRERSYHIPYEYRHNPKLYWDIKLNKPELLKARRTA